MVFGVLSLLVPEAFRPLGLRSSYSWPFVASAILFLANLGFLIRARRLLRERARRGAGFNLWSQILVDLPALTMVVHFLGSLETHAPFMYLAHVVLACIFFSRRQSLTVAFVAGGLYTGREATLLGWVPCESQDRFEEVRPASVLFVFPMSHSPLQRTLKGCQDSPDPLLSEHAFEEDIRVSREPRCRTGPEEGP